MENQQSTSSPVVDHQNPPYDYTSPTAFQARTAARVKDIRKFIVARRKELKAAEAEANNLTASLAKESRPAVQSTTPKEPMIHSSIKQVIESQNTKNKAILPGSKAFNWIDEPFVIVEMVQEPEDEADEYVFV